VRELRIICHRSRRSAVIAHQLFDPPNRRRDRKDHNRRPDQTNPRQPGSVRDRDANRLIQPGNDRVTAVHSNRRGKYSQHGFHVTKHDAPQSQTMSDHAVFDLGNLFEEGSWVRRRQLEESVGATEVVAPAVLPSCAIHVELVIDPRSRLVVRWNEQLDDPRVMASPIKLLRRRRAEFVAGKPKRSQRESRSERLAAIPQMVRMKVEPCQIGEQQPQCKTGHAQDRNDHRDQQAIRHGEITHCE